MRKERIMLKVSSLVQNNGQLGWLPKNPRQWTQTDIDRTAASIREDEDFLEDRPLLVVPKDAKTWVVFAGNLRLTAAKKIGLKEVPCIAYARETDEDDTTIKRRAMKDNGSFGAWDYDALANEWDDLPLADWGVPAWEDNTTEEETTPAQPDTVQDDFNEDTEVETRCNPGDIWQLGNHRLMCGDSTDGGQVALLMNGEKADMVFTDPPYGYQYQSNFREKTPKMEVLKNDDRVLNIMPIVAKLCDGWVFLCTTWKVIGDWLAQFTASRELTNMVVWSKGGGGLGDLGHTFSTDYELILVSNGGRDITGKRLGSVWEIMRDSVNNYEHPTQKPVRLPATAIENVSNPGDSVLDLFGGSGSTLIAAEQLNRKCYMMELDPHYCDVIISRWEKLTGKTAQLITPGDKVS